MSAEAFTHDVFLSHSAKGKAVVRPPEFHPLSFSLQPSPCDPLNQERRFIPLRLDDAPVKGFLRKPFVFFVHYLRGPNQTQHDAA